MYTSKAMQSHLAVRPPHYAQLTAAAFQECGRNRQHFCCDIYRLVEECLDLFQVQV